MPSLEAPCVELGNAPQDSVVASPSPSEISSASSPEPQPIRATPLFRALAMPPPDPEQPRGQDELERRLPGYQRIVIPRELTLIELLKQSSGVSSDDEVLQVREARLRVVAERVGLRRLNILAPRLRSLTLDGSALTSLRDLGIGLVHLKVLSVNRCGLTSLDGVWGLGSLRELSAAGNRLHDLQPLAALQKLHTLNLSDNPISDTGRLWTLGICSSLRRLTLTGTAATDSPLYRSQVAAALPMLVYLDDRPLHTDVEYDSEGLFGVTVSSESGESDDEVVEPTPGLEQLPPAEPEPGPSSDHQWNLPPLPGRSPEESGDAVPPSTETRAQRRRPATTEGAGVRPTRPHVPPRPRTALERPLIKAPTKLHIMNTLMDIEKELIEATVEDATRTLASEIPKAPNPEDWIKFKKDTGIDIDIDIDFNQRPQSDGAKAIERLERIEKETFERFKQGNTTQDKLAHATTNFSTIMNDFDAWKLENVPADDFNMFNMFNMNSQERYSDNSESRSD